MPAHAELTEQEVLARGGWHPRYARVLAVASAGDFGFAIVDGNGDGAELEQEWWFWAEGSWQGGSSSGTGSLDYLSSLHSGAQADDAYAAYGRASGPGPVLIRFDGRTCQVSPGRERVWVFVGLAAGRGSCDPPSLA
ncbi:MAG TPA: hypothetical protein VGI58_14875 [Streptosporangiaceae bacterium]